MTNVTEFLGAERLAVLPLLCGIPAGRSDYERFRAFCRSAERFWDSADTGWVRAVLQSCFDCVDPPDRAHCDAVWRSTSAVLFERGTVPELPDGLTPPQTCPELPQSALQAVDCPAPEGAVSWDAWCAATGARLAGCAGVRVTLSDGFRARKTSLWHAERLLRGEEKNRDLALTQQVDFLAGYCSAACRLCLETDCEAEEVRRLLVQVSRRRGSLPPLCWNWQPDAAPDRDTLVAVAALVRTPEGVPPVVWRNAAAGGNR